jgi:hypothetical protein
VITPLRVVPGGPPVVDRDPTDPRPSVCQTGLQHLGGHLRATDQRQQRVDGFAGCDVTGDVPAHTICHYENWRCAAVCVLIAFAYCADVGDRTPGDCRGTDRPAVRYRSHLHLARTHVDGASRWRRDW